MLSPKFTEALIYATELHANQMRKGSGVPYIAHLLGVVSIALEYGAVGVVRLLSTLTPPTFVSTRTTNIPTLATVVIIRQN